MIWLVLEFLKCFQSIAKFLYVGRKGILLKKADKHSAYHLLHVAYYFFRHTNLILSKVRTKTATAFVEKLLETISNYSIYYITKPNN